MVEVNNTTRTCIDVVLVKRVALAVLLNYKKEKKELSVAFVGETVIRRLNLAYRGKDKVTDILSFDGEGDDLGELVICYQRIKKQGPQYGQTPRQELIFILVHGILHLLGYTDDNENDRLKMIVLGEQIIKKLKLK